MTTKEMRTLSAAEIAELEYISPEIAASVLQEYHRLALTQQYLSQGGPDYAQKLLVKAFGETGARSLLEQVMQVQEAKAHKLDTLQKADPQQLAKFIQGEHPQTIALVLAQTGTLDLAAIHAAASICACRSRIISPRAAAFPAIPAASSSSAASSRACGWPVSVT